MTHAGIHQLLFDVRQFIKSTGTLDLTAMLKVGGQPRNDGRHTKYVPETWLFQKS